MLRVRAAEAGDRTALLELAKQAGAGFTSLAVSEAELEARLEKSVSCFSRAQGKRGDDVYLLMLEDVAQGMILGMSAVKAEIGIQDPFFSYRILKIAQKSTVAGKRFDMNMLALVNEYAGASEVGSLFVLPQARGGGGGRLISQARYMLMATDPARFGPRIVSELRGVVDESGFSPFWEAIGRKFFQMDFGEADYISATEDKQFILDLMPKYPIYIDLLPESARAVIGQTHPLGQGAQHYLEVEGFRYDGVIDIFDGGPCMSALYNDVRTIRESSVKRVESKTGTFSTRLLVSCNMLNGFRCIFTVGQVDDESVVLQPQDVAALEVHSGDEVRVWLG